MQAQRLAEPVDGVPCLGRHGYPAESSGSWRRESFCADPTRDCNNPEQPQVSQSTENRSELTAPARPDDRGVRQDGIELRTEGRSSQAWALEQPLCKH